MTAPGRPVTAFLSWAHLPNPGVEAAAWREQVLDLAAALRALGIDADVDLYHLHDPLVDWSRYGPAQIDAHDFTLVAVNDAWRRRFEGVGDPTAGAGAAAEADQILGLYDANRDDFQQRLKLILLPGAADGDVPPRLSRAQRFTIAEPTAPELRDLLRTLTGQPEYVPSPLGSVPVLPPATRAAMNRTVRVEASDAAFADEQASATVRAGSGPPDQAEELDADIALLRSTLRQQPPSAGPDWQQLHQQLADAQQRLAELENQSPTPPTSPPAEQLAKLVDQLGGGLQRGNRCWLQLVATPTGDAPAADTDFRPGESSVDRRRRQLQRWTEQNAPIPQLDTSTVAVRRPGRVAFTGDLLGQQPATYPSGRWRLELSDDGSGAMAAVVSDAPRLVDRTGTTGWKGTPGESLLDAEAYLPVRRDLLETWLLTELELLVDHVRQTRDGHGQLHLLARLEPPLALQIPQTHGLRPLGVRVVDEKRNPDGQPIGKYPPAGAADLPLDAPTPISGPITINLTEAAGSARLVGFARQLAVDLLEHFGVEQTAVLRPDGTLNALAAARAEWMAVHGHARQLGLPVDTHSPADRVRYYDELIAEARKWLNP